MGILCYGSLYCVMDGYPVLWMAILCCGWLSCVMDRYHPDSATSWAEFHFDFSIARSKQYQDRDRFREGPECSRLVGGVSLSTAGSWAEFACVQQAHGRSSPEYIVPLRVNIHRRPPAQRAGVRATVRRMLFARTIPFVFPARLVRGYAVASKEPMKTHQKAITPGKPGFPKCTAQRPPPQTPLELRCPFTKYNNCIPCVHTIKSHRCHWWVQWSACYSQRSTVRSHQ
eukprot:gene5975-biopygen11812